MEPMQWPSGHRYGVGSITVALQRLAAASMVAMAMRLRFS
jgi:hypothetical protein